MEGVIRTAAKGGTELLFENLCRYVPKELSQKVHISVSMPQSGAQHIKSYVLWEHQSYDQPSVQGLKDRTIGNVINRFVFVSEWQKAQYLKRFPIPIEKISVIHNAIEPISLLAKRQFPLKLIYTSTPFRGLDVLLDAFALMNKNDIELHVYSGMSLYGRSHEDARFESLYTRARSMKNVFYHGVVSNEEVREALQEAHIFAYPCTWEETSCLSLIEALSAGCCAVMPELGALSETASGFAQLYPYLEDKKKHAERFANELRKAIDIYWDETTQKKLQEQKIFFDENYSWAKRKDEWIALLENVIMHHGKVL